MTDAARDAVFFIISFYSLVIVAALSISRFSRLRRAEAWNKPFVLMSAKGLLWVSAYQALAWLAVVGILADLYIVYGMIAFALLAASWVTHLIYVRWVGGLAAYLLKASPSDLTSRAFVFSFLLLPASIVATLLAIRNAPPP